jgi:hypothetical protein
VTDQLHLSLWLERGAKSNRLKQFRTLLRLFPFSQREQQPQSTVSIQAVNNTEPPLLERALNGPVDLADVESIFAEYSGDDIAYEIDTWWDLWQFEDDWKLKPAAITLSCFSADFDNGTERPRVEQEDIRIDFGVDTHYLPQPDLPGSPRMVESNVKSLLRLVHQIDAALQIDRRLLETESGENFADRLQRSLMTAERPN